MSEPTKYRLYLVVVAYCSDCNWKSEEFLGPTADQLAYSQWVAHKESGKCTNNKKED